MYSLVYSYPVVLAQGHKIGYDIANVASRLDLKKSGDIAERFKFNAELKAFRQKATSSHAFELE